MKKKVKLSDFPINEENPFMKVMIDEMVHHTTLKISSTKKDEDVWINHSTGEAGNMVFVKKKVVDDDKFAKIFLSQFQAFFDLTTAGIRVFGYIMTCLRPKEDMIWFMLKDCMAYTKYSSKAPIYKGLAELLEAKIIARGETDYLYFINPLIAFNGDRVSFCTSYEKKSKHKQEQLSLPFKFEDNK